jgi:protein-disulfide isomerase
MSGTSSEGRRTGAQPFPNRRLLLAGVLVSALVLVAAVVGLSLALSGRGTKASVTSDRKLPDAAAVSAAFRRIPQHGLLLGAPDAPVTLVEYLDLQCPWCGRYARDTFPEILSTFVRPGAVRVEMRPLAFVGGDSVRGRDALLAAAHQDKAFQFAALLYANQGTENTGWLSTELVRAAAASVPGLDAGIGSSVPPDSELARIEQLRARDGVAGVPSFVIRRSGEQTGGTMLVNPDGPTLEAALKSG